MINGVSGRDLLQVALFLIILLVSAQPLGLNSLLRRVRDVDVHVIGDDASHAHPP
jgi:hypothetical protein